MVKRWRKSEKNYVQLVFQQQDFRNKLILPSGKNLGILGFSEKGLRLEHLFSFNRTGFRKGGTNDPPKTR